VDVVVPFAGSDSELERVCELLGSLERAPGDSLIVADNRAGAAQRQIGPVRVVAAAGRRSPAHARNRGADLGQAPWLLFIDADVLPQPDLLSRYFEPLPADRTGVLVGGVHDEEPREHAPAAIRYACLRQAMSQSHGLANPRGPYGQTANLAVRRCAFAAVRGFRPEARRGEDADLCFRLAAAGWALEERLDAAVEHRNRRSIRGLLRQRAVHGWSAAWLERHYPGAFPRRRWPGLAWWSLRRLGAAAQALVRRDSDQALLGALDPLAVWAFELGRLFPGELPRWLS
jgi:GT2 family glycosyltransferase